MTRDFSCLCLVKSVVGVANRIVEVVVAPATYGTSAGVEEVPALLLPIWAIATLSMAGLLVSWCVASAVQSGTVVSSMSLGDEYLEEFS